MPWSESKGHPSDHPSPLPEDYLANEQSYTKMRPALVKKFRGKWVAVGGGKVIASGDAPRPVLDEATDSLPSNRSRSGGEVISGA
jgi:hypothetical protein